MTGDGSAALLWALLAVPLIVGTALAVAGRAAGRAAPGIAVAASLGTLGLACAAAVVRPAATAPLLAGLPARFAVDGLSATMAVTVAGITTAVLAFAATGADDSARPAPARFHGLMLLFAGAMLVTVTATGMPALLMGWEVMGGTSWALIAFWWRDPERVAAAGTAFLTTRATDLGLYVAAGAGLAGGVALADRTTAAAVTGAGGWGTVLLAGVIVAALGKSAQLPFSFWLSRAMRGPAPVSALLHSATMVVAGAYLLLRYAPALRASGWGADVVIWAGAGTAVVLGLVAVAQTDLKQVLAASSSAQIGFMVLAAGVGSVRGGALQLVAHAAAKSLAFLVAGAWLTTYGTQALAGLRGVAASGSRAPALPFTLALLTLAGLPPLALWPAKDVLLAATRQTAPGAALAVLVAGVVAAAYSARVLALVWRRTDGERAAVPRTGAGAATVLGVLGAVCAAWSGAVFWQVDRGAVTVGPAELALTGCLSAAVCAAVWWVRPGPGTGRGVLYGWLGLDAGVRAVVVRPVLRLARALARFDERVLDRAVEATARGVLGLARGTARRVEPALDSAPEGIAAACRALGRRARLPQTGQLHQYLAQTVAAFALLALVLVLVR